MEPLKPMTDVPYTRNESEYEVPCIKCDKLIILHASEGSAQCPHCNYRFQYRVEKARIVNANKANL